MSQSTEFYGYLPSEAAALFGIIYFGTSAITIVVQIVDGILRKYKHYWLIIIALASAGEAIGWGARLWAHSSPENWLAFTIQICSLIVSPVFISAADYVLYCKVLEKSGSRLFHLPTKFFWILFVVLDIISLAIQTVGGILVSSAQNYVDLAHGSSVMLSGIKFQFSSTVIFAALLLATEIRLRRKGVGLRTVAGWPSLLATLLSTIMIFARNAYRIAELADGWKGHLMRTEWYLIAFDMAPVAVAIGIFVVFNPCFFLSNDKHEDCKRSSFDPVVLVDRSRAV